jgi:hypothetical protein
VGQDGAGVAHERARGTCRVSYVMRVLCVVCCWWCCCDRSRIVQTSSLDTDALSKEKQKAIDLLDGKYGCEGGSSC